jgi:hypothetical protein
VPYPCGVLREGFLPLTTNILTIAMFRICLPLSQSKAYSPGGRYDTWTMSL